MKRYLDLNDRAFNAIKNGTNKTLKALGGKLERTGIDPSDDTLTQVLALKNKELDVRTLYSKIGSDVTDYNRKSII